MPEQAKKIREYKPQPDPVQEKLKEIELQKLMLENKKLEADIADKYARAKENGIDAEYKSWKAKVEQAKARKLGSEADRMDLDFLKEDEGVRFQEDMEKERLKQEYATMMKEYDRRVNLEAMEIQARNNDTNIGMVR